MNPDTELEAWRGAWQSDDAVPAGLRRRAERQSRWMRIMIAGDILVTVVIGGGSIALAARAPEPDILLLAAVTWLFIAVAWAFRLILNRGLWSPSAMDTAAFVNLLIRRCRVQLAATVFGAGLYVCEIAFCLGWIYHRTHHISLLGSLAAGPFTLAFFGGIWWYRRKKRAELAWLLKVV